MVLPPTHPFLGHHHAPLEQVRAALSPGRSGRHHHRLVPTRRAPLRGLLLLPLPPRRARTGTRTRINRRHQGGGRVAPRRAGREGAGRDGSPSAPRHEVVGRGGPWTVSLPGGEAEGVRMQGWWFRRAGTPTTRWCVRAVFGVAESRRIALSPPAAEKIDVVYEPGLPDDSLLSPFWAFPTASPQKARGGKPNKSLLYNLFTRSPARRTAGPGTAPTRTEGAGRPNKTSTRQGRLPPRRRRHHYHGTPSPRP